MATSIALYRLRRVLACAVAASVVGLAPDASAQTAAANEWRQGTTLAGFFGAASPASDTQPVGGAALGWEIAPHFTLEGRAMWLDAGRGSDAFAAVFGSRVPLLPARTMVPFLSAGVGIYRATFDASSVSMPGFYQRRMAPREGGFGGETFDDFLVSFGGGVDIFLARHLALRPDVTVLLVTTRSDTRAVPVYGLHLAYHFESHPVTPAR